MVFLKESSYGKIKIRLMRVNKHPNGVHVPHEVTVDTMLWGDFDASWTEGSNTKIVATDTQKNIIYGIAHSHDLNSPEEFGKAVCAHFIKTYSWITKAQVTIREEPWARIQVDGKPHNHAFTKNSTEKRYAQVTANRAGGTSIVGGLEDLIVLKTAQGAFETYVGCKGGFVEKDAWTTLPETNDRIVATAVKAYWNYASDSAPFNDCHAKIKARFLSEFAGPPDKGVPSPSVQLTQYKMCTAAVEACAPHVLDIKIQTPNMHYIEFPVANLGLVNRKEVFYPIDGPSGYIVSTTARSRL